MPFGIYTLCRACSHCLMPVAVAVDTVYQIQVDGYDASCLGEIILEYVAVTSAATMVDIG